MFVLGHPPALRCRDRSVEIVDDRRRRIPGLERGGIDEWLECRPGLALRLCRAVESALVEIAAADHRAHVAGGWIHRHKRTLKVLWEPCFTGSRARPTLRVLVS